MAGISINWGDFKQPEKKVDIKNITLENYKDLIGLKFFYNSEFFKNIPFNIIGDGELRGCLKVQTWEGRRCVTNKLNGKIQANHYANDIIEMINDGKLSLTKSK